MEAFMKKFCIIFGNLGLLLSGVFLFFPAPAHATPSPISFTDYSVADTATTNGVQTNSQTLTGPPPTGPQSGTVIQNNPTSSAPSKSSITAGVNPTEILRTYPAQSTSPYISIAQTVTALGLAPLSSSSALANSVFSADFKGTGNVSNLYVNYFAGGILSDPHGFDSDANADFDSFGSNLVLTVKNLTTNALVGSLNVMGNADEAGSAVVQSYSGFILNQYTNGFSSTGPLFLYFVTQSTDSYQISGDMSSIIYGNPSKGGTGLSTFDLVANTPEPSTCFLFGTGMALLGFMGLGKRKGFLTKV